MTDAGDSPSPAAVIRALRPDETDVALAIINAGAQAYRDVIPPDRWHEPYMSAQELAEEIAAGVAFTAYEIDGALVGVMGMQDARNVALVRHAYVDPAHQGRGIGGALLAELRARVDRPILIGTWAAADWAIGFYERHGFRRVRCPAKDRLLRTYWTIPERQVETSVVLAAPALDEGGATALIAGATAT